MSTGNPIVVDGLLGDWLAAERIDGGSVPGYQVYAKSDGTDFVFALSAPTTIDVNSTAWLNTDRNAATGYQIFGWAGGAEYNVNVNADGTVSLYSGGAGETLVLGGLAAAWSADRTALEFRVPKAAIGNPQAIDTLYDVNNSVFLPGSYSATPFPVFNETGIIPAADHRIAIVYSETTAKNYFSETAYSQLFMSAQSQAMQAGVAFDILRESDLTSLATLAKYDAIVFPDFRNVNASQAALISQTLEQATKQFGIGLIASGEFMTNDESNNALPGDSYARMKLLFDVTRVTGGFPADVTIHATDANGLVLDGYANGELVHSYTGVGWNAFTSVSGTGTTIATETVNGTDYASVIATQTGGRNVVFSSDGVMTDANMLQKAIDYAVNGSGVSVGLQLTRQSAVVASRIDMDTSMRLTEVNPEDGSAGVYDLMMPVVANWKQAYNFVGSYYVNIGDNAAEFEGTDWAVSLPYYAQLITLGNELGSHSYTHPFDTNLLTAAQLQYEFQASTALLEQKLSAYLGKAYDIVGAAVPGAPERIPTTTEIMKYVDSYLSGGYSGVGAGYPSAFGYLNPDLQDKIYLAPNTSFDFTLLEFQHKTLAEADAAWQTEWNSLTSRGETPIVVWPWHDYGAAMWEPDGNSPYSTQLFTDWIARAANADSEFVTLADLAARIRAFDTATVTSTVSGDTITATVAASNVGTFALDVDGQGSKVIKSVAGWYAYDSDSVYLPTNGGTYTINLGATQDDVTHITELPMRASLVTLSGDGHNLNFTVEGEGKVVVDLAAAGTSWIKVTGATVTSQVGELMTLDVGAAGSHAVSIAYTSDAAPVITSNGGGATASISLAENKSTVTTVVATDANGGIGDKIGYSILAGGDGALFTVNATTGVLAFTGAPDFETPRDANGDNIYLVNVAATDSKGVLDTQQISVKITNVAGVTRTALFGGTMNGTDEEDTLNGSLLAGDTLNGLGGNDTLNGSGGSDTLNGGAGKDTLDGGSGNDILNGEAGIDKLTGGAGTDRLSGGADADMFIFTATSQSGTSNTARDIITDFQVGFDKLDFSGIDANTGTSGNQAFTLKAAAGAAITGAAQLHYFYQTVGGVEYTVVEGNVNTSNSAEFAVALVGHHTLSASDFIL